MEIATMRIHIVLIFVSREQRFLGMVGEGEMCAGEVAAFLKEEKRRRSAIEGGNSSRCRRSSAESQLEDAWHVCSVCKRLVPRTHAPDGVSMHKNDATSLTHVG